MRTLPRLGHPSLTTRKEKAKRVQNEVWRSTTKGWRISSVGAMPGQTGRRQTIRWHHKHPWKTEIAVPFCPCLYTRSIVARQRNTIKDRPDICGQMTNRPIKLSEAHRPPTRKTEVRHSATELLLAEYEKWGLYPSQTIHVRKTLPIPDYNGYYSCFHWLGN